MTSAIPSTINVRQPQDWRAVLSPPEELARQTVGLLPHAGVLNTEELVGVSQAVADRSDLWMPLLIADGERRRYRLLYEDDRIDVWVLCWMPGQGAGFHDHDVSSVGIAVASGMVVERQMLLPTGATRLELYPGDTRQGPPGYIHSAAWGAGEPAVSIHSYSPPLLHVGQYKVNASGVLERRVEHGRQELMDNSIASLDPTRADG
jgi:Cysteine dioxygenase type I